jgi:hypothetical protein
MTKRQCIDRINATIEDTLKEHAEFYTPSEFEAQPYAKSSVAVATVRLYVKAIEAWAIEVQTMAKTGSVGGKAGAKLIVPSGGVDLATLRKQVALDAVAMKQNYFAAAKRKADNKVIADAMNAGSFPRHGSPGKKKSSRKRGTPVPFPVTSPKWSSPAKKRQASACLATPPLRLI